MKGLSSCTGLDKFETSRRNSQKSDIAARLLPRTGSKGSSIAERQHLLMLHDRRSGISRAVLIFCTILTCKDEVRPTDDLEDLQQDNKRRQL